MEGEELIPMHPWWRGFKGDIKPTSKNKYDVTGIVTKLDDTTVEITELPIHKWTQTFKAELEAMMIGEKGEVVVRCSLRKDWKEMVDNLPVVKNACAVEKAHLDNIHQCSRR